MKHEILPDGRLRIYCTPEEVTELRYQREQNDEEPNGWGSLAMESEALEPLICNSELDWIPEGATGDLTSAPMLGILGGQVGEWEEAPVSFGMVDASCGMRSPIIARWAYMSYQVRSFLDDLADNGECFWEGGYAETPQSTES